jgi:hypothetical protein
MPKTKFTQGRWWVTKPGYVASDYDNDRFHGVAVTLSPDGSVESEADAHLIAAAPDLYAALEKIVGTLIFEDDEGLVTYSEQVIAARAAMAKARGEVTT